jgi:hypothetical protein
MEGYPSDVQDDYPCRNDGKRRERCDLQPKGSPLRAGVAARQTRRIPFRASGAAVKRVAIGNPGGVLQEIAAAFTPLPFGI